MLQRQNNWKRWTMRFLPRSKIDPEKQNWCANQAARNDAGKNNLQIMKTSPEESTEQNTKNQFKPI